MVFDSDSPASQDDEGSPIDEQLVAYLDGELSLAERQTLEQQLTQDATLRRRLQELESTWRMLDVLPEVTPDDRFTETTLQLVTTEITAQRPPVLSIWKRVLAGPAFLILASLVCTIAGFLVVHLWRQTVLQRQLRALSLVEHLEGYLIAIDLPWVSQLDDDPQWRHAISAATAANAFERGGLPDAKSVLDQTDLQDRITVVKNMDSIEKNRLLASLRRYEQLPQNRRRRVDEIATKMETDPKREERLRSIDAYARFRENWPAEIRNAIERSDAPRREEALKRAITRLRNEWNIQAGEQLPKEDVDAIYTIAHALAGQWLEQWNAQDFGPRLNQEIRRLRHYPKQERAAAFLEFLYVIRARKHSARNQRRHSKPNVPPSLLAAWQEKLDYDPLRSNLSEETIQVLSQLAPSDDQQNKILRQWLRVVVRQKLGNRKGVSLTSLQKLEALPPDQREHVELLPAEQLFERLDHLYRRQSLKKHRPDRRGGKGRRGRPRANAFPKSR